MNPRPPAGTLFGRADALERLAGLLAGSGRGLVLVTGEAGIGKSALVSAALDGLDDEVGTIVVQVPLRPDRRFAAWSSAAPLLGVQLPDADPTVGPSEQVAELTAILAGALAERAPVVVAVEDLHRADASSLEVLAALPAATDDGVRFVATSRPVVDPDDLRLGLEARAHPVRLGPLEPSDVGAMVASLTGAEPGRDQLDPLVAASGGNPLLVRELALDPAAARRSSVVDAVIGSVLDRLDADAAEAVELLAVAGPGTPDAVLADALGVSLDELRDRWRRAFVADVLVDRSSRPDFRHDLLAETALARVSAAKQRDLHGRLAAAWAAAPRSDDLRRVRHLVSAAAPGDAATVVEVARRCARDLVGGQRHADAADLLGETLASLGDALPGPAAVELAADLGDVRWRAGFVDQAVSAYRRAAELAATVDDPHLRARAEVGRLRRSNPFLPDPDGRATLAALDAALEALDGDSALRVAVLGRRAALARQPPPDNREAIRLADEGVAMARRLGDDEALVGALEEWGLAVAERDDVDQLGGAAVELQDLAQRTGRGDLLLTAHEWRFADHLRRGELDEAEAVVREVEARAAVSPSPMWRLAALQRRMLVHAYRGERTAATHLVERIACLGAEVLDDVETRAIQVGPRASMSLLYGTIDPQLPGLLDGLRRTFDAVPAPFIQIGMAAIEVALGDVDGGLRRARPWLREPHAARSSPRPVMTLGLLAQLAHLAGDATTAAAVHDELAPHAGRIGCMLDHGVELPVDHHLAGLALVAGRVEQAEDHALAAVQLARRMGSPVLAAVCLARLADVQQAAGATAAADATRASAEGLAERVGVELDPPWSRPRTGPRDGGRPHPAAAELVHDADGWQLVVDGTRRSLPDLSGLPMLARLLANPGVDVTAGELAGRHRRDAAPLEADLGPMLDARAKRAYRQRIADLQDDVRHAEADDDLERASRARLELELLLQELRRAVGLGGRDRPQGSSRERDRVNVTRNLGRAIKAVEALDQVVGGHLRTAVRTGSSCVYAPDPTAGVQLTARRGR